ncbi:MAG: protein kinase [Woeseiaceae bacterium]|jgi:serine/threonine protein kinase
MTAAELHTPTYPLADQDLIAGRFRLQERIGQGRLGDIFDAVDTQRDLAGDEQHIALQIVADIVGSSNSLFNKLRIGYQSLQAAGHPNIVKYGTLGRDGSTIYLVMERLDGAPLNVLLEEAGNLPLVEALPVVRGVGDALRFLHDEDLVHGNLTAANVFITNKLDVRLLDVVPSIAANAIFRGTITSKSKSLSTEADDVFALACLAYQMLAGRHPFDHSDPARIGLAGREPERIEGLTDHRWKALRRALTLDEEQPDYPIADFLRDFGVQGTERLQSAAMSPVKREQAPQPEPADSPSAMTVPKPATDPIMQPQEPVIGETMQPKEPAPVETMESLDVDGWPGLETEDSETSPWRAVLLAVLLAGLAAWSYFAEPEEHIVGLIAYLDSSMNLGIAEQVEAVDPPASRVAAPEPVVANDGAPEPEPVEQTAAEQPGVAQPETEQREAGQPAPAADVATADSEPAADPETIETQQVESLEAPVTEPAAEEPPADEPEAAFTPPVVTVSEQNELAEVALPSGAESQGPLVWWTSEHTARADTDFIAVPEQAVVIAPGDTLDIRLVDDNLPEERESFFVDIGVRQPQGQIERVATIRVDIIDDDMR